MDSDSTAPAEIKKEIPVGDYLFDPKRVQQMIKFRPDSVYIGVGLYNAGFVVYLFI
jgi:hypothetical protein